MQPARNFKVDVESMAFAKLGLMILGTRLLRAWQWQELI